MAVLLSEMPPAWAGEALPHKTWTRDELDLLQSAGVLKGERYELIEGELIGKMGKKRRHVSATTETARALRTLFGDEYVNTEAPVDVAPQDNPTNEPEPDVVVLRRPSRSLERNPGPSDLLLVVEISDSTLRQDLTAKCRLYARAGIEEYWVLDLNTRRLHVFQNPSAGLYQVHRELGEGESVTPLAGGGTPLPVSALLP